MSESEPDVEPGTELKELVVHADYDDLVRLHGLVWLRTVQGQPFFPCCLVSPEAAGAHL
jgi:hypothetical protein